MTRKYYVVYVVEAEAGPFFRYDILFHDGPLDHGAVVKWRYTIIDALRPAGEITILSWTELAMGA